MGIVSGSGSAATTDGDADGALPGDELFSGTGTANPAGVAVLGAAIARLTPSSTMAAATAATTRQTHAAAEPTGLLEPAGRR